MNLFEYVIDHTERGACRCGRCLISGDDKPMTGHTADLMFFSVCMKNDPKKEEFVDLVRGHKGQFGDVNPLDGREHGYIELGGWIGDQGLAMQCMGLGSLLGVWKLMTPRTMLGDMVDDATAMSLAGSGLVTIAAPKEAA